MSATRPNSIPDTENYKAHYLDSELGQFQYFGDAYHSVVYFFSNFLNLPFPFFSFLISFLSCLSVISVSKFFFKVSPLYSLLAFSSYFFVIFNFVTIRASIALSIFLFALVVSHKSKIISLALLVGSFFFHFSFVLVIPFYLIYVYNFSPLPVLLFFCIASLLSIFGYLVPIVNFFFQYFLDLDLISIRFQNLPDIFINNHNLFETQLIFFFFIFVCLFFSNHKYFYSSSSINLFAIGLMIAISFGFIPQIIRFSYIYFLQYIFVFASFLPRMRIETRLLFMGFFFNLATIFSFSGFGLLNS